MDLQRSFGARLALCGLHMAFVVLAAALLSSCAPSRTEPSGWVGKPYTIRGVRYQPRADPDYDATGIASWYGKRFHGRTTASGERFDQNALSAAHTTLPLGTHVRVTNLENGRSLLLRINDRGPFVRGRIIDVSRAAAAALGFELKGLARVRVQFVVSQTGAREFPQPKRTRDVADNPGKGHSTLSCRGSPDQAPELGQQEVASVFAGQDTAALPTAVEEQQGNVADAVCGGQAAALGLADVGDQKLDFSVLELGDRLASFTLQGAATGALRVVNLNDGRDAVADP